MVDTVVALLRVNFHLDSDTFAQFKQEHLSSNARESKFSRSKFDEKMYVYVSAKISTQISFKKTRQSEEEQGRRLLIGRALSR